MDEEERNRATMISGLYLMPDGEDISLRLVLCKQRSLTCSLKTMACTLATIYGDLDSSAGTCESTFPCTSCQLTLRQRSCCARCMKTRRPSVEGSRVVSVARKTSQNPRLFLNWNRSLGPAPRVTIKGNSTVTGIHKQELPSWWSLVNSSLRGVPKMMKNANQIMWSHDGHTHQATGIRLKSGSHVRWGKWNIIVWKKDCFSPN